MAKYLLNYTGDELFKIIQGREHSPIQDVVGDNYITTPLSLSAATEYDFECNGNIRNFKSFPDHITNIWSTSGNTATFVDLIDTVEMVSNIQFTFTPDVAAAGVLTVKVYVNETVPILMKELQIPFKASETKSTALLTYYTSDSLGFDVKNKGVKFTIESTAPGLIDNVCSVEIYRT